MVSLCICIVYVRYAFQRIPDILFFQHTDLVYICYILWDVFPIYFHCIRLLHFLKAVSNSFLDSARLHLCYIYLGGFILCICIVYVRYTFQRIPDILFFQHTDLVYICYILWDVFPIFISIVYVRYTF